MEDNFPTDWGWRGWFGDDSNALHLLCTLLLLLLHQPYLSSSGIRSQRLGTPDTDIQAIYFVWKEYREPLGPCWCRGDWNRQPQPGREVWVNGIPGLAAGVGTQQPPAWTGQRSPSLQSTCHVTFGIRYWVVFILKWENVGLGSQKQGGSSS